MPEVPTAPTGLPPTKLSFVLAALARGDGREALRLAAKFPKLGDQRARILSGWGAVSNPSFYRQLGKDPAALEADGVAAIRERYGA